MTLRFTLALSLLATYFLLPETSALVVLSFVVLAPFIRLKARNVPVLERADLLAAWAYEKLAQQSCRQSVLARLSGGEVGTLLEACSTLENFTRCTPSSFPESDTEDWIVSHLRSHRLDHFRKDDENIARLIRAVESDSPRLLKGPRAVEECRRLCWSRPQLVIDTLKEWTGRIDSVQRFHIAVQSEPQRIERLISLYYQNLDRPGLSPTEEVSIFLQFQEPRISEILQDELGELPRFATVEADQHFVAEKFVTRLWSLLAIERPAPRS